MSADKVLQPHRTTDGVLTGRIRIAGWADDHEATGEMEISPLARRRIRYRLNFTAQGRSYSSTDGSRYRRPVR